MKKIMPTTLLLLALLAMLIVWWLLPADRWISFPERLLGSLPLLVGLGLSIMGSNKFEQVGTNIKTFADPDVLITDGLYRFSRNPMYLGFVLVLLGVTVLLGSLSTLLVTAVYFLITDRWYIQYEEQALTKKFGARYQQYKTRTRRWI
jgi:protein-S-isoprenylcysteine O-methyltransferase Ste14